MKLSVGEMIESIKQERNNPTNFWIVNKILPNQDIYEIGWATDPSTIRWIRHKDFIVKYTYWRLV